MATRGDGIGLEVTSTVIRAIRLDRTEPSRVRSVSEVAIANFDDDGAVYDCLIRTRSRLAGSDDIRTLPTRLAWFPVGATLQRLDVTGKTGPELNVVRHELAERVGITSTMLVDVAARRWLLALRWDHARAWRIQELAERAGFGDVTVEPSPVAIERVLHTGVTVARRDASPLHSWVALLEGHIPIAAAGVEPGTRLSPGLGTATGSAALLKADLETALDAEDLSVTVAAVASQALELDRQADELELMLNIAGHPYPPFPAHDPRAPQRIAVALGAAVGAAGLVGRLRPVDVLTPTSSAPASLPKPWAIERLPDRPLVAEPPPATSRRRRVFGRG